MPIQPVILAKDKESIGQLLSLAPPDLQDLGAKVDFIHLDGSRPAYWKAGIDEVIRNMNDLVASSAGPTRRDVLQPEPEPTFTHVLQPEPEPELEPEPEPGLELQ